VVILEDAESVDPRCLGTLVVLLSDAAAELPVVLLAGMSTSVSALQTMLPAEAVARLRFRVFRLPSALQRFETIVRTVLLGESHDIALHLSFSAHPKRLYLITFVVNLFFGGRAIIVVLVLSLLMVCECVARRR
jgi:hypothetical protein